MMSRTKNVREVALPLVAIAAVFGLWGCGAGEFDGEDADTTGVLQEPVLTDSPYDVPVAAANPMGWSGDRLWVFTCDKWNRLVRIVRSSPNANFWNTPEILDEDCGAPPAIAPVTFGTTTYLFERALSDGALWFATIDESGVTGWVNLSSLLGIGAITGPPVALGYEGNWFGVAVHTLQNRLLAVNNISGTWSYQNVQRHTGSNLVTKHTVAAGLTGRGSYSGDDTVNWIASPLNGDPTQPWKQGRTFSGATGIGTFTHTPGATVEGDEWIVARFGSQLKYSLASGSGWTSFTNCSVEGSPLSDGSTLGYVRSSNGTLMRFSMSNHTCTEIGGTMSSAATMVNGTRAALRGNFDGDVLFKGPNGFLWYHDISNGSLTNLFVLMP